MNIDPSLLVFGAVAIFNAGVQWAMLLNTRQMLREEMERNKSMRHEKMDDICEHIDRLKILLLSVIPKEQWPRDL